MRLAIVITITLCCFIALVHCETYTGKKTNEGFTVGPYADGTSISGWIASDRMQLGPFYARTSFGAITVSDFDWPGDGILALGMDPEAIIPPLMLVLSGKAEREEGSSNLVSPALFGMMLTEDGGEMQIGGYNSDWFTGNLAYTQVAQDDQGGHSIWQLPVQSMRMDDDIIYQGEPLPAIIDSGASCLEFPADIFLAFQQALAGGVQKSLFITIGAVEYEVTFDDFSFGGQTICAGASDYFSLGDPFFRAVVGIFDVGSDIPRIGLAPRNRQYQPVQMNVKRQHTGRAMIAQPHGSLNFYSRRQMQQTQGEPTPVTALNEQRYYTTLIIGDEGDEYQVLLDTGSSVTAVNAESSGNAALIAVIIVIVVLVLSIILVVVAVIVYRRRRG